MYICLIMLLLYASFNERFESIMGSFVWHNITKYKVLKNCLNKDVWFIGISMCAESISSLESIRMIIYNLNNNKFFFTKLFGFILLILFLKLRKKFQKALWRNLLFYYFYIYKKNLQMALWIQNTWILLTLTQVYMHQLVSQTHGNQVLGSC